MLKLIMSEESCDNILVRGVNWVGDAVMTMPALRALKLANNNSKITLLVKPWVSPLFEKDPNVDEIILYKDEYKGVSGKFRLANVLRKKNFCMAVLFQNAFDAAITAFLARIPERFGYSRDGRGLLLTKAIKFDDRAKGLHHTDYYLNLLDKAGFKTKKSSPWIYLSLEERLQARDKLKGLKRPVIAINPGATFGSSKRWHPERFAQVAERVINELKGSVVIFGGPKETEIAEEIFKSITKEFVSKTPSPLPSPSKGEGCTISPPLRGGDEGEGVGSQLSALSSQLLNLAGRTSLRELAALISECDLLVTNDSGPMHVGYAVGTPVVAIFGSTSPEHTGPIGKNDIAIKKNPECSPCFERECKKNNLKCMDMITSEEVFESIKKLVCSKRAVFIDRDGTLCRDADYLKRMEDLEIFPSVSILKGLKNAGFSLIGVSNQSGIARGFMSEDFVRKVNNIFINEYAFDAFYYCPHAPDENCSCRKPEPGLLFEARAEHKINLKKSFVVGDKEIDMLLAKAVGAKGLMVKTGKENYSANADFIVKDLSEAVKIISDEKNQTL